jgi:hypothetical protein
MHTTGMPSPLAGGASTPGSMSVGPQSCSRSQLSGFTAGHVGAQGPGGGGMGRHAEMHEVETHSASGGVGTGEGLTRVDSMPACGCRCVIS